MVNPALKSLIGATVGATALSLVNVCTAQAAVFNLAFRVQIDQGPFQGTHTGSLRFDSAKMVSCPDAPLLKCATPSDDPSKDNLSLIFEFMGERYDRTSDFEYATRKFPAVYASPELNAFALSFIVMPPKSQTSFAILGESFYAGFTNPYQANQGPAIGKVSYFWLNDPKPDPPSPCLTNPASCPGTAVPEPSEIAGSAVAVGLVGLFARSRRKKAKLKL